MDAAAQMAGSGGLRGAALGQPLFRPGAVALIGATADQAKNNARAQRLLVREGFAGRIVPVNPSRAEIMGVPAYPSVADAPGPIDHAFIMVPAAAVPGAIADCGRAGVKVATIFTAGFAEVGPAGAVRQAEMLRIAREGGVRVLGPNCLGLFNVTDGVPLTVNAAMEREKLNRGWISIVSQSGSMMGALMSRIQARGLGFARLVSVGNECDIGVGEVAEMLVEDDEARVVLLFIETFRDSACLARAARRAHALGKAVVALKLGRSETGRRLAASHTGAILGGDEQAAAFFRAHGIMRVDTLEGLVELPRLVVGRGPPRGRRVAGLTGTGGAAALVLDRLGGMGCEVVGPPAAMRAGFAAQGFEVPDAPLIDLPMGGTRAQYNTVLAALVASDHCDAVLAVLGSTTRLRPEQVDENILCVDTSAKPMAVFIAPEAEEGMRKLDVAGVAGFRTPETCADALHAYLTWRAPAPDQIMYLREGLLSGFGDGVLDEAEALQLFQRMGIAGPGHVVVGAAEAVETDGPAAVKVLSPDISHKTEAGLVRLNVAGGAISRVVAELLERARAAHPAARIRGALVAPMQLGLVEVILGYRRDPEVGPVVVLGMGGVLAELKRSIAVRLAPVDEATALEMIGELVELRVITGYRNLPHGDVAALARAIVGISQLAGASRVIEAEINPLLVRGEGEGVVALDGLVTLDRTKEDPAWTCM